MPGPKPLVVFVNKSENLFSRGPGASVIRASSMRMWFVSALGRGGGQFVQVLAVIVLARLLVPEDFGLVAMAMVFIGVAEIFRDFGLSAATVRSQDLQPAQASAMFVVNVVLGILMTAVVFFLAPLVGGIYGESEIVPVLQWLSWIFAVNGVSAQHQALLRRQLKFGVLAWVNFSSIGISQILAIILALKGYGYWSLVIATLASSILRLLIVWVINPWRPGRPEFDKRTRSMMRFGGYLTLFGLIGFAIHNAHSLIIGERFSTAEVGFYDRPFVLLGLGLSYVMAPLASIVPASLSRVLDDSGDYKELYLHYVAMMMLMTAPLGFIVALTAKDLIDIILGEQWLESVLILQLLALSVIPRTLSGTSDWLYQSRGDSRRMMQWGLAGGTFILLFLLIGVQFGILGVALAYSIAIYLQLYPCLLFAYRKTNLHVSDLKPVVFPMVGASVLALLPVLPLFWLLQGQLPLLRVLLVSLVYVVIYLGLMMRVFGQRELLVDMLNQLLPKHKAQLLDT